MRSTFQNDSPLKLRNLKKLVWHGLRVLRIPKIPNIVRVANTYTVQRIESTAKFTSNATVTKSEEKCCSCDQNCLTVNFSQQVKRKISHWTYELRMYKLYHGDNDYHQVKITVCNCYLAGIKDMWRWDILTKFINVCL